jgi:hypothetical protein
MLRKTIRHPTSTIQSFGIDLCFPSQDRWSFSDARGIRAKLRDVSRSARLEFFHLFNSPEAAVSRVKLAKNVGHKEVAAK